MKKAKKDEKLIVLSVADADKVFSLIENPPEPNTKLKAAIRRHKEFFGESR